MSHATIQKPDRIAAKIAPDSMSVTVALKPRCSGNVTKREEVLDAIRALHIEIDQSVEARVDAFVEMVVDQKTCNNDPFVVFEGKQPLPGQDEQLEWDEELLASMLAWREDGDFFPPHTVIAIQEGAVIGTLRPPVPPQDGWDVTRSPIPAEGTHDPLELDETIRRSPTAPQQIIAGITGKLEAQGKKLKIVPCHTVTGDVDFEMRHARSHNDIHIEGRVADRTEVVSARSVVVGQSIEAATVSAARDVAVCRGVVGRNAGSVHAGGDIFAKYANMANLVAGGDVRIAKQLMNSQVFASGKLLAASASVIGGVVYAEHGVEAASLGSTAGVPTRIVVGIDAKKMRDLAVTDRSTRRAKKLIDRIREVLGAVGDAAPHCTPAQTKQAADLQKIIDDATKAIEEKEQHREKLLKELFSGKPAAVRIKEMIYAPTTIHIGERATKVSMEIRGPVSIEQRTIKRHTQLVAVFEKSGTVKTLTFDKCSVEDLAALAGVEQEDQSE